MVFALIPAILWLGEHVLGPLTDLAKSSIESGLRGVGSVLTGPLILEIFEKVLGPIEDTKKQELLNALASITAEEQINVAEAQSPKPWWMMPHATLEMLGTMYIGSHLFLLTLTDWLIFLGFEPYILAPVDLTMFGMVMTLMGVYKIVGKFNVPEDNTV